MSKLQIEMLNDEISLHQTNGIECKIEIVYQQRYKYRFYFCQTSLPCTERATEKFETIPEIRTDIKYLI